MSASLRQAEAGERVVKLPARQRDYLRILWCGNGNSSVPEGKVLYVCYYKSSRDFKKTRTRGSLNSNASPAVAGPTASFETRTGSCYRRITPDPGFLDFGKTDSIFK